ncbi:excinuclease ABC subunit A [Candidatus Microgenomates bacterium]|jgi:excinuclease ABC subunit A|nr:MAG: excinuclease ABC subunit A [Candidatus Microgenomates bacterium]
MEDKDHIIIKGAREHNLADITVKIPKNKLVVLSGVSGSGKSSLAMDTLYAEGQRRYVESLSSYARQFLGMMKRPEIDSVEGLSPAIAIDQHGLSHNPRSTVGTVTEIYDYLRVLYARIGHPHCPKCGREISHQTSASITEQVMNIISKKVGGGQTARFFILSPVIRDKRGEFSQLFLNLQRKGFEMVRIDGQIYYLRDVPLLIKTNRHNIEVVIDKINIFRKYSEEEYKTRILNDIEIALDLSDGLAILSEVKDKDFNFPEKPKEMGDTLFSRRFVCPVCNLNLPEIEPRLFSFNSPQGACPECNGLGVKLAVDRSKVSSWRAEMLEKQYYTTTSDTVREEIEKLMIKKVCPLCHGDRLKEEALSVTINQKSIADISALSLESLLKWLENLVPTLSTEKEKEVADPLLREITSRLNFLIAVGVDYLTLGRTASTLSVGEAQRIRLASQIGTGLTGVLYVLDEPTVGLHQRDTQRLIETLKKLKDLGNTVVVVEHDEEVLLAADWIIDFGPEAGKKGGQIIAEGTPEQIMKDKNSLTGLYLSGRKKVTSPEVNPELLPKPNGYFISLFGCSEHNLKNIDVKFPLKKYVCITGVSGSGKSTLIHDTLYPALAKSLDIYSKTEPGKFESINGVQQLDQVLLVDQSPVGRTSRSNPATYTGVFTDIRELFTQTEEARLRGFTSSHFSFNVNGGRCEACQGQGFNKVEMQFLPDVWVECEECHGTRFKEEILEVQYKEKNIHEVLELTIGEALEFFASFPKIVNKLKVLQKIGLDYLELGQPSPTLSGGESQRLKLARELVKPSRNHAAYLLDEPTTGLHFADVDKLLQVIRELVGRGNTVIVIEHNLDMIKNADWVIDLGPEGGERGGEIIAQGKPAEITANPNSWTGKYLKNKII